MSIFTIIIILCTYIQSLRADLEDREARLRAQDEEMRERDAEINRLLGELRRCQAQLLGTQVHGAPFNTSCTISCHNIYNLI